MKTLTIFSISIFFSLIINCQIVDFSQDWINQLEKPGNEILKLKQENLFEKYKSYDFSNLIKPETEFLGYIGSEYQRIFITF